MLMGADEIRIKYTLKSFVNVINTLVQNFLKSNTAKTFQNSYSFLYITLYELIQNSERTILIQRHQICSQFEGTTPEHNTMLFVSGGNVSTLPCVPSPALFLLL
jgi:hypothetical protein